MFVVVAFDETNETDFAPVKWIADKTRISDISKIINNGSLVKFYWPPLRSASAVSRAQLEQQCRTGNHMANIHGKSPSNCR